MRWLEVLSGEEGVDIEVVRSGRLDNGMFSLVDGGAVPAVVLVRRRAGQREEGLWL